MPLKPILKKGSPRAQEGASSAQAQGDRKQEQLKSHSVQEATPEVHDIDMEVDNGNIEADAEIEAEADFDALLGDEDFIVTDSTEFTQAAQAAKTEDSQASSKEQKPKEEVKQKYVIPKVKHPENESPGTGRRESSDANRDKSPRDKADDARRQEREKEEQRRGKGAHSSQASKTKVKEETKLATPNLKSFIEAFNLKKEKKSESGSEEQDKKSASAPATEVNTEPGTQSEEAVEAAHEDQEQETESETDVLLEIPEGRDSVASQRESCAWQIRIFPLNRLDVLRSDFNQVWAIADASSIAWSGSKRIGGVGEFLLCQRETLQKFTRKAMFHTFSARRVTIEITEWGTEENEEGKEEEEEEGKEQKKDQGRKKVLNRAIFRFSNHMARKLIKPFYPTAKGEMTERSVYVNNVSPGVSVDIIKAIFPCALKISVAKASKEASLGLVETESAEAAFNYLVVYDKISINGRSLTLTTTEYDWQSAKDKFAKKKDGTKRPASSTTTTSSEPPAKKDKPSSSPSSASARGRGTGRGEIRGRGSSAARGASRGGPGPSRGGPGPSRGGPGALRGGPRMSRGGPGASRGGFGAPRGGPPPMGRGRSRGLLPDPVLGGREGGGSEGLLPLPPVPPPPKPPSLLTLPAVPPPSGNFGGDSDYGYEERDPQTAKLQRVREQLESEVRETRASLVMATRRAEAQAVAQLQKQLSLLERISGGSAGRSGASLDYHDEEEPALPPPRRPLLQRDDEGGDWPRKRPGLLDPNYDYDPQAYPEEEDYNQRPSGQRGPRPYLLDAPDERRRPEKDLYKGTSMADTFEYGHKTGRGGGRYDDEPSRPPLLGRRGEGLLERPKRGLLDDDRYDDYDAPDAYPPPRRSFEGEAPRGRRPPPRGFGNREAAPYGYDRPY